MPSTITRRVPELSEDDVAAGVMTRFRAVVEAQPDALAVADADDELTFLDVATRAAAVMQLVRGDLASLGPSPDQGGRARFDSPEPVAMIFDHSTAAVTALLGIVASGHPVLVLDQRTPVPRLRQFIDTVGARLVLCDSDNQPLARELTRHAVLVDDDIDAATPGQLWSRTPDPALPACVAFTSGSTGTPKPVANSHRLLVRDAWNSAIATQCYGADDIIAHTLPIAFHAGLTTTIHGLLVGATMRLFDARTHGIAALPAFVAEHACTMMITSPGILRGLLASDPDPADLASLRVLTTAGEASYARDVEAARALLPRRCSVRNRYGSSETGLIAEYVVRRGDPPLTGQLPAGAGVGRTRLIVVPPTAADLEATEGEAEVALDASHHDDRMGRLVVVAPDVALGYWGLPELTQEAFGTDPETGLATYRTSDMGRILDDGSVMLVGRADHSVKIRGYLVDPGEVDAVLFAHPSVREAVTVGAPHPHDTRHRLVSYVVARGDALDVSEVRRSLLAALPVHMVPETFVALAALPRNDRGKIDRAALPEPPLPAAPTGVAPVGGIGGVTEWEEIVAHHWAEVLGTPSVSVKDDFFALGGDSLVAEALMARLVTELGVKPQLATTATLAQHPVLRDFAASLQGSGTIPRPALVPLHTDGSKHPLFCVAGGGGLGIMFQPLAKHLLDRPVYALQSPVIERRGLPERSVRAIARRHIAVVRAVQPDGPYHLAGHSFGGIVAHEMAHQLRAAGAEVSRLVILDSFPPDPDAHPPLEAISLRGRVRRALDLARTTLSTTSGGTGSGRLWDQSRRLGHRHRGAPWDGDTLVLVADSPQRAERAAWAGSLSGRWRMVDVGGDHITMLRSPWLEGLVGIIEPFLDDEPARPSTPVQAASGPTTEPTI